MSELVALDEVEVVMVSTIGTVGLAPTLNALRHGKVVGLSNKEPIVMAGSMLKEYERTYGGAILPVDSEPSAIWQCLQGENGDVGRADYNRLRGALSVYAVGRAETCDSGPGPSDIRHGRWGGK